MKADALTDRLRQMDAAETHLTAPSGTHAKSEFPCIYNQRRGHVTWCSIGDAHFSASYRDRAQPAVVHVNTHTCKHLTSARAHTHTHTLIVPSVWRLAGTIQATIFGGANHKRPLAAFIITLT